MVNSRGTGVFALLMVALSAAAVGFMLGLIVAGFR